MKAQDAIKPGETAVAIFTRGDRFKMRDDGSASTGNWVLSQRRRVDKVIIYRQNSTTREHEIFVGTPVEIVPSAEPGRRVINLTDVRFVGSTPNDWNAFTDTKPGMINPIKYVKRR